MKIKTISVGVCTALVPLVFLALTGIRDEASAELNSEQKSQRALQFITEHGTAMASIMGDDKRPRREKRVELQAILEEHLDLATMIRTIIGPYWRKMTDQQRERYRESSRQWVLLYSANFLSTVKPTKFEVHSANLLGKDVLVKTETLSKRSDEPFVIHWRVRFKPNDEATLIDMRFRGLSMIAAQRTEVIGVLAEQGIPIFLDKLDERVAKIKKEFNKN